MSGNVNCQSATDKMNVVIKVLDEYEDKCGLPSLTNPCQQEELNQYLQMNRTQIEKLSSEDCVQIAYRLDQTAFYIQRLYNREQARILWAQNELNSILATQIDSYNKYWKHEMKVAMIVKQDPYAAKLHKIVNYATQRTQRLTNMAFLLSNLSNTMKANQRSKYVGQRTT